MKVPATKPYFSEEDITFITERFKGILRGESFLSMHKYGAEFERKFAESIDIKHGVGCSSGTAALELICRALNVSGKEVILPSNTFVASANAILNAGGIPVFADCNDNLCMDAEDAIKRITLNTAAIMQVHIGGVVSRSTLILQKICKERGLHLIEDAAQAHGSGLNGIKAGAFGVAAGFSFFSTKVMTTGEGGMVTTNDATLAEKMKSLREFGKVKKDIYNNYYTAIGYNWRLPEIASLMGIRQLAMLNEFVTRRQELAKIYDDELTDCSDISIVDPIEKKNHNYFKYIVILKNHDRVVIHKAMEANDIQPSGYIYELPLHRQPIFSESNDLSLPKTEYYCAHHLCLPIFYGMTDEQAYYVSSTLKKILAEKEPQK